MNIHLQLTQIELDQIGCGTPDCRHDHSTLFFHAKCHPNSPAWVKYEKVSGTLIIQCAECDEIIAVILVADGEQ